MASCMWSAQGKMSCVQNRKAVREAFAEPKPNPNASEVKLVGFTSLQVFALVSYRGWQAKVPLLLNNAFDGATTTTTWSNAGGSVIAQPTNRYEWGGEGTFVDSQGSSPNNSGISVRKYARDEYVHFAITYPGVNNDPNRPLTLHVIVALPKDAQIQPPAYSVAPPPLPAMPVILRAVKDAYNGSNPAVKTFNTLQSDRERRITTESRVTGPYSYWIKLRGVNDGRGTPYTVEGTLTARQQSGQWTWTRGRVAAGWS